jgi:hypothetical protein
VYVQISNIQYTKERLINTKNTQAINRLPPMIMINIFIYILKHGSQSNQYGVCMYVYFVFIVYAYLRMLG